MQPAETAPQPAGERKKKGQEKNKGRKIILHPLIITIIIIVIMVTIRIIKAITVLTISIVAISRMICTFGFV